MDDPYAVFPTSSSRRGGGAANGQLSPSALPVNILNLIISHVSSESISTHLDRESPSIDKMRSSTIPWMSCA